MIYLRLPFLDIVQDTINLKIMIFNKQRLGNEQAFDANFNTRQFPTLSAADKIQSACLKPCNGFLVGHRNNHLIATTAVAERSS